MVHIPDDTTPHGTRFPEWLRIPAAVHQFGLSRAKLYQLAKSGKIRSASLRDVGESKGTRLFEAESIRNYIERCVLSPSESQQ